MRGHGQFVFYWGGALLSLSFFCSPCLARDWPQYRGADHNGISTDRIIKQWTGPVTNPVWLATLSNGISSVSVSGGRAFTQVCRTNGVVGQEICLALSITNGAELWAAPVDLANYPDGFVGLSDDGPRTTPTVNGGSVFVLSSYLKLSRLNATNGALIWQKDLRAAPYFGSVISWQNAASPLLDGELIFVNANAGSARLMAFHAENGALAWRSQNELMTHSTPVVAAIQGVRQLIFASQSGLVSLDPASGRLLWKFPYPFTYSTSLAVSPVVFQNLIYISIGMNYGRRSVGLQVTNTSTGWTSTQLWTNNLSSTWMTPVCYRGFLYGQFDDNRLKCINMQTGLTNWSGPNTFARGGTILVDDHLVSIAENGQLVLVKPITNAYTELGRFLAIPNYNSANNKCWNAPAVCDGRVYVRSTAYLACFDLSVPDLKLDLPRWIAPGQVQLTARTVNGAPLASNRLAGLEFWTSTNPTPSFAQWSKLTNTPVLTNGAAQLDAVDTAPQEPRYFIVSEPK